MATPSIGHTLTEEELFCLRGCDEYKQYYKMRRGFEQHLCPFCTIDPTVNKVLLRSKTGCWMFWQNPFRLKAGMKTHYLLVPRAHVRQIWGLTQPDFEELGEICETIGQQYGAELASASILIRQGDMRYNAGTVPHLHWNLHEPDSTAEVRLPLFKKEADIDENIKRMCEHAVRYEAGELP